MRTKALLVALFVAALAASVATAKPPPGKGKPETGVGCKPQVSVILAGTLTAVNAGGSPQTITITVQRRNGHGKVIGVGSSQVVKVDASTKIRRNGPATLASLVTTDRVQVQLRVCKADTSDASKILANFAKRVVAHPAKS